MLDRRQGLRDRGVAGSRRTAGSGTGRLGRWQGRRIDQDRRIATAAARPVPAGCRFDAGRRFLRQGHRIDGRTARFCSRATRSTPQVLRQDCQVGGRKPGRRQNRGSAARSPDQRQNRRFRRKAAGPAIEPWLRHEATGSAASSTAAVGPPFSSLAASTDKTGAVVHRSGQDDRAVQVAGAVRVQAAGLRYCLRHSVCANQRHQRVTVRSLDVCARAPDLLDQTCRGLAE